MTRLPSTLRRLTATLAMLAMTAAGPGSNGYVLFAQEVVRPNVPVSPSQGAAAVAGGVPVNLQAPTMGPGQLSNPLGLPPSAVPTAALTQAAPARADAGALAGPPAAARVVTSPRGAAQPGRTASSRPGSAHAAGPASQRRLAERAAAPMAFPAAAAVDPPAVAPAAAPAGGRLLDRLLWREARPGAERRPTFLGRAIERLSRPAQVPKRAEGDVLRDAAERDFEARRGGEAREVAETAAAPTAVAAESARGVEGPASLQELPAEARLAPVPKVRDAVAPKQSGTTLLEGPAQGLLHIEGVAPDAALRSASKAASATPEELSAVAEAARAVGPAPAVAARARVRRADAPREVAPSEARVQHRSVLFPVAFAAIAAAAWLATVFLPAALGWAAAGAGFEAAMEASRVGGALHALWSAASGAVFVAAASLAAYAALDVSVFLATIWAGRGVSEERFHEAVRDALRAMGLGAASVAALAGHEPGKGVIHPYTGRSWSTRLSFGFTTPHGVYLRPELARFPWLLRLVLRHELYHYQQHRIRGPPAGGGAEPEPGLLRSLAQEVSSRLKEVRGSSWLADLKIPVLERVLREAQVSLSLPYSFDVVVVKPAAGSVEDPSTIASLSGGRARVHEVAEPSALPADAPPARLIVMPGASSWLPRGQSEADRKQAFKLERALRQLDEQYLLSRGLLPTGASPRGQALHELEKLSRGRRRSGASDEARYAQLLSSLWRQVAASQLKGLEAMRQLGELYSRLQDRGVLLLPFREGEPGVDVLLRLLRYWEGPDGGRLQVARVDLPEGGHVLVARKLEARVNLWLKPLDGRKLAASVTNVSRDPAKAGRAEELLREAGFGDEPIALFKRVGVEVRHAFGADVGENRIFISVPKRRAKALRRYAEETGASIETSQGGYKVHLLDSGPIQNLPRTWRLGVTGQGGRIFDIDTGIDVTHPDFAGVLNALAESGTPSPRVTSYDVTGEGDNDYIGHGTHKASISYANGTLYKGMAPGAEGRMGKVFTKDGFGANDGDIMAAAAEAMRWGADVISLSLGSPGDAGDSLSVFFSNLAQQKTSKGHKPIITASMGNSGPFNRTGSQPAAGENVIAVAAAAKSLDDKDPEISFYSSVGFARDTRYHLQRWVLKPSITALGGDVRTVPGSKDVYDRGIEASKSKDMEPSPSDTPDRLRTRMSGTSMSNPMIAGIALLVKQVALRYAKARASDSAVPRAASASARGAGSAAYEFFVEQLPYAVRVILERSAVDMRVPVAFQGAGFVDAYQAARLAVRTVGGPDVELRGGIRGWLGRPAAAARNLWRALRGAAEGPEAASEESPWDWIARAKAVQELEKAVYDASEKAWAEGAKKAESKKREGEHPEAPREEPPSSQSVGDAANAEAQRTFNAARDMAVPTLVEALKDPVWLVRYYAAFALMNLKSSAAVLDLAQAAVGDSDGRVRQAAFMALAATPNFAADALLANAVNDARPDVAAYAAYALARHGNPAGVERLIQEATGQDKKMRFTAVWLLGEIGGKAGRPGADALGRRVRDIGERGDIRHLSAAALTEVAASDDAAITDESIVALLDSAGEQDLALTRTISKFFSAASRRRNIAERMRNEPLRARIVQFILANKGWVGRPGALGEMVSLLARVVNVPLDIPSPAPDVDGTGVPGVDPNLGPVHLLVEVPAAAKISKYMDLRGLAAPQAAEASASFGLDPQTLSRHEAAVQVAMPVSQHLWVNVPDAKVAAFTADLEARGYRVRRASPKYRLLHDTGKLSGAPELHDKLGLTGKGVLVVYLDEGGDLSHPAIARERVAAVRNFSDEGGPEEVTQESIGHGTHGMGIVGGRSFEGSPYVGMAPDVKFAIGKVLGANGGSDAMVMAGMEWAASLVDPLKTPVVVNMSLGGPGEPDSPLSVLVNRLQLGDVAVVAAAGNEGPQEGTIGSPANAPLAFKIGALDKEGKLTFYSSRDHAGAKNWFFWVHRGGKVDFELPNPYEIVSTLATAIAEKMKDAATTVLYGGKPLFQTMSGTSMAAPHATGQLAQLAQRLAEAMLKDGGTLPHGYWLWLGELVSRTAQAMPDYKTHEVGAGLFDARAAAKALEAALQDPERVRKEAFELAREANERFGGGKATGSRFWLRPLRVAGKILRRWLAPSLTAFSLPTDRLAVPAERGAQALVLLAARASAARAQQAAPWFADASATHASVSLPLYALRREKNDPGVGKFTDLGRYYREALGPGGARVVHLLPHFAVSGESPYAAVSQYAVNEDYLDWSEVPEVRSDPALLSRLEAPDLARRQAVDYASLREREGAVARAAYDRFARAELEGGTARAAEFKRFLLTHAAWLEDYAEFRALSALIGKPSPAWRPAEIEAARKDPRFAHAVAAHRYAQWLAYGQLEAALAEVHAAGGRVLFDVPMFSAKDSVETWKRPELYKDLATRNPGIVNEWVKEDWKDLALWNWTRLGKEGYEPRLAVFKHWLGFGFDGARVDALHFAYDFGNGQLKSGDEPGDPFVRALAGVFSERGAFPLAEAFEGKAANAERFGFVTVYGDWKKLSSHDDRRGKDFLARFKALAGEKTSGRSSRFVGYTLGDEWGEPFPVKGSEDGRSTWRYRIPLPSDPDYARRVTADGRDGLGALTAALDGDVWKAPKAVAGAFRQAADGFVKREGETVKIWAASLDWFLDEWGRDTFISLPGLLLSTGRFADAKRVLLRFAKLERDGLVPNWIPDPKAGPRPGDYNTVDGSMWFVQAVERYALASGDRAFVAEILPVLRRIMTKYAEETGYERYGRFNRIFMDSDGLIVSPKQATWMDADPEGRDKPVTPRDGKAVEINALWYANLRFLARLEREAGDAGAAAGWDAKAELARRSFNEKFWFVSKENRRFWGGTGGALRDVVEGDPHGEQIRPNMLFAVSHGGDLLSPERRRAVVLAATKDLLTPFGLRTLSFRDPRYRASYDTSRPPLEKDQAYHQGTAWPWLIGAYADALARVRRDQGWSEDRIRDEARGLLTPLVEFLARSPEGSLPEVFDGGTFDEALRDFDLDSPAGLAPVVARLARSQNRGGTRSQAWSVAEVLRLLTSSGLL